MARYATPDAISGDADQEKITGGGTGKVLSLAGLRSLEKVPLD